MNSLLLSVVLLSVFAVLKADGGLTCYACDDQDPTGTHCDHATTTVCDYPLQSCAKIIYDHKRYKKGCLVEGDVPTWEETGCRRMFGGEKYCSCNTDYCNSATRGFLGLSLLLSLALAFQGLGFGH
ncbi:hypothetical protein M3Y99_00747700 [Aphelenchoides fujianensis]|nr:hypothetical protein M3Y99_00747700 [Aphelenchoides fujianensis]